MLEADPAASSSAIPFDLLGGAVEAMSIDQHVLQVSRQLAVGVGRKRTAIKH